jgi:isopenicillin N synthase-like dioxygenase
MGPNVWPPLPDPEFKEPVNEYFTAIYDLTITILQIIAYTLPYGPNIFSNFIANDPAVPLRLLHYPPQTISSEKQLGASAHTDFGAITLLLQDENAGLEVRDEETGEWCLLPPREDAFVVNIGDMLSMWTEGMYKSSVHRVLNKGGRDRYSVAFFFDGNLDCKLEPLGGGKGEWKEAMTCEQYMFKRMTETYGGGK